ncbi:MAG: DUF2339 domain-containing protein [Maricaulaceae bacterium]
MELLVVVAGLFFIASPVFAIIALINSGSLKREVEQLRREVKKLQFADNTQSVSQPKANATSKPQTVKPVPDKLVKAAALDNSPQIIAAKAAPKTPIKATVQAKPPVKPQKPATPPKPKVTIEEMIGSQWSVWVGGIALAIGAVFLIRYSIEAGVFSPAMRIAMAGFMGLAALAGGEWMRRNDMSAEIAKKAGRVFKHHAYIPGVLTAIGIFTWLGTVYASYVLYDFIGPTAAFILLGLTSLLGLALSLLHGPKLAALGLVAAFVTPLLVNTGSPNYLALYGYLLVIGAAALVLARKRDWHDITTLTLFGVLAWLFISLGALKDSHTTLMWIGFALTAYGVGTWSAQTAKVAHNIAANNKVPKEASLGFVPSFGKIALLVWTLGLAVVAVFAVMLYGHEHNSPLIWAALCLSAAFIINGARWHGANIHILIGGALSLLTLIAASLSLSVTFAIFALVSLAIWGLCFRESRRDEHQAAKSDTLWTSLSVVGPLFGWMGLLLAKGRLSDTISGWLSVSKVGPFEGAVYLAVALVFAASAEYLWRKNERTALPINIYALGSGAAVLAGLLLCLNIDIMFYAGLLSLCVGLGLYILRPLWSVRIMIVGALGLSVLFALGHHISGGDVGQKLIFNSLWIFLALPAALSFAAGYSLERKISDIWSEILKAATLSLGALFVVLQIHHMMNGGEVLAASFSLEEAALFVLTGLCFTLGGSWLERNSHIPFKQRPSHKQLLPIISMGLSAVSIGIFAFLLCLMMNPLLNDAYNVKGNIVLNSLVLAYALPAVLFMAISLWSKDSRPLAYTRICAALGFAAFMLFVTGMVRFMFSGANIDIFNHPPEGMELYMMSAVWLLIGIGMLVFGLKTKNRNIRLVSGGVIIVTVLKAFLIDMANLEGVLRAMSFVILGLVLIVIGRVYQKLIFADKPEQCEAVEPAD